MHLLRLMPNRVHAFLRLRVRAFAALPATICALVAVVLGLWMASAAAQGTVLVRVGIAVPAGNSSLGLPAIAQALSAETLIGLGLDGRPTPRLAQRWEASSDGLELRLHIAPNLRLHSGERADGRTIARLLSEALQSADAIQMHSKLKDSYRIEAEGESTVLLRSRSPRILALEELANITLRTGAPDGGLGAFVVDSLTTDSIRLHGFELYFKGPPSITRVQFQVYRSQRAAWTGLMRDEADALYEVNRDAVGFVERESKVRTHSFLRPYVSGIVFNVSKPVFRSPNVRRALVAGVNRAAIVEAAYRGRAQRASGPLAPMYWAIAGNVSRATHNANLANSLLERFPLSTSGKAMPARLRFRCLVPTFETQPLERTALIVQKQLYDVGVSMELELVSVRALLPRLAAGDFDAVLMEFFGATPSWISYFWHSPSPGVPVLLNSGYSAADRELEAMDAARNEQELRKGLADVYRRMADDPPAIFIAWPEVTRAVSTRFDVPVEKGRDIMGANLWLWRPAKTP